MCINCGFNAHFLCVVLQVWGIMNDHQKCADASTDVHELCPWGLFTRLWTDADTTSRVAVNADGRILTRLSKVVNSA